MRASPNLLRLYYFVAFGVLGLYLPYFPSWLRAHGFVGAKMSALVALLPLCQLAAPSVIGMLSDERGMRGRMMSFCAIVTALGMSGFALGAFFLDYLPFAFVWCCMLAFAALRSPSTGLADVLAMETGQNYGKIRLWGSLGFMCSAAFGGRVIDPNHPYQLPALIALMLWLLVGVSYLLPRVSHLPPRPALLDAKELLKQKAYRQLLATMVLITAATSAYDLCSTMFLINLGASGAQIGAFWTVAVCAEIVLMYFSARFVDRIGPGKLLTFSCLVAAGRWLFLSQAQSLTLIILCQPLHAFSFALMWVSAIGVLRRELGTKGTATAHGLFSSSIAVGGVLGLSVWATVFERFGGTTVFACAAAIVLLAALSAARLIRFESIASLESLTKIEPAP